MVLILWICQTIFYCPYFCFGFVCWNQDKYRKILRIRTACTLFCNLHVEGNLCASSHIKNPVRYRRSNHYYYFFTLFVRSNTLNELWTRFHRTFSYSFDSIDLNSCSAHLKIGIWKDWWGSSSYSWRKWITWRKRKTWRVKCRKWKQCNYDVNEGYFC